MSKDIGKTTPSSVTANKDDIEAMVQEVFSCQVPPSTLPILRCLRSKCFVGKPIFWRHSVHPELIACFSCQKCDSSWNVCMICLSRGITQQKRLSKNNEVEKHMLTCHKAHERRVVEPKSWQTSFTKLLTGIDEVEVCVSTELEVTPADREAKEASERKLLEKMQQQENNKSFGQLPSEAQEYFRHLQQGTAMRYLVNRQVFGHSDPTVITEEDAELHVLIASISYELSNNKNEQLARIFELVGSQTQKLLQRLSDERDAICKENKDLREKLEKLCINVYHNSSNCGNMEENPLKKQKMEKETQTTATKEEQRKHVNKEQRVPLPITLGQIRKYTEGATSIIKTLPTPTVYETDQKTAYVKLEEAFRVFFPYGIRAATVTKAQECGPKGEENCATKYWDGRLAKQLFLELPESPPNNPTKKICMCQWQDGADPGGTSKGNRGSFHGITASILSDQVHNSQENTFVLAIGKESSDHSDVRKIIYDNFKAMETPTTYFNGICNEDYQTVHLATMEDRKERGESHAFGSHNGQFTHRFGYSGELVDEIVSCKKCQRRRLNNLVPETHRSDLECKKCFDWSFDELKFQAPDNYPEELGTIDEAGHLMASKVTGESMVNACELATTKLNENTWKLKTSKPYLRVAGLNTKVRTAVEKNAKKETQEDLTVILPPRLYLKRAFERNVEAIMHLLFLGNTELIGDSVHTLLIRCNKWTDFHSQSKKFLLELRGLYLDWAKFWTFGSTKTPFGPYVSENCLALVRGMKSIYSNIDIILTNNNTQERKGYVKMAKKVISAWVAVVSRIMATRYTDSLINSTERHIKVFLSYFHDLEELNYTLDTKKDKTNKNAAHKSNRIFTTGNMVSMLNIPDQMRNFGPLRLFWEGGYKGEGILALLKMSVTQGTHMPYFATAALKRFYNDRALGQLLAKESKKTTWASATTSGYHVHQTYKNVEELDNRIAEGKPLSGVWSNLEKKAFCATGSGRKNAKQYVEIKFDDQRGKYLDETWNTTITQQLDDETVVITEEACRNDRVNYMNILYMPNRSKEGKVKRGNTERTLYYTTAGDWLERRNDNTFEYPRAIGMKY